MNRKNSWTAVAIHSALKSKPLRVMFEGQPVVIFKSGSKTVALPDRCPHRHAALSNGVVIDGEIECPYHGWRFKNDGRCSAIPGYEGERSKIAIKPFVNTVEAGIVFLSSGKPQTQPYTSCVAGDNYITKIASSSTTGLLIDAAENILDATHTHFVHNGLLRGLSDQRQTVRVDITGGQDFLEATYVGEEEVQGVVSKLFEGKRTKTVGRFRAPGIAELEYWDKNGVALATTFHLRQSSPELVEGIAILAGPNRGVLDKIKALVFRPMFSIALAQDQKILKSSFENRAHFGQPSAALGPLDFLRDDIDNILNGKRPIAADTPRTCHIEL